MITIYKWNSPALRQIWEKLYTGNPYIFPYSSYEYNEQIIRYMKVKPATIGQKNYFVVYEEEGKPIVMFPLYVKKDTLHLLGQNISGAGHLDVLYNADIQPDQWKSALSELQSIFPGKKLQLTMVNERSKLCQFLREVTEDRTLYSVKADMDRVCVKIPFPDTYEDYEQGLSRNSRSNLHKAYSKIRRNQMDMSLQVVQGPFIDKSLLSEVMKIYTKRESERKHRSMNFFPYLKHRYFSALVWAMEALDAHYTFCLFLNHKPAAFMTGFVTNYNEIVFPYVAIDSSFGSYAPGKLMIAESIKWLQAHTQIRGLDLSRGDERYKLEMGGVCHYNYRFEIQL